jgi:hypothetical protein
MYITVDAYYNVSEYNRMLQALENNGIEYSQWVDTKVPHQWYIKVADENQPKFIDFDVKPKAEERYLVSAIVPQRSQDSYLLMRRDTDPATNYSKFVMNDYWNEAFNSDYMIIFKFKSPEDIRKMSQDLGCKIYQMGTHRWKLSMAFNKYVKGYLTADQIIFEKTKQQMLEFRNPGELEAEFNYRILRTTKIEGKTMKTTYWNKGILFPAIKVSNIINI